MPSSTTDADMSNPPEALGDDISGDISRVEPFDDDVSAQYLEIRRRANAPSLPAWEGALQAGQDPGKVVLGIPLFDVIETRTDGEKVYKVGVDNDNPENNIVLEVSDVVKAPVSAPAQVEGGGGGGGGTDSVNPSTPMNEYDARIAARGDTEPPRQKYSGSLLTGTGYGLLGKEDVVTGIVADTVEGFMKGTYLAAQDAGKNVLETFMGDYWKIRIEPWLHENIPYLSEIDKAFRVEAPKGITQEVVASITAPVMQVIAPGAFLTRAFRAAGISGRFLSTALGYGTAEVVAVSPKDATILELGIQLIGDSSDIKKILDVSLRAQEDANSFMLRLKNAPRRFLEGGPIGMVFERLLESVGMVYRVIKNSPNYEQYIQEMMGRKKVVAGPGAGEPPVAAEVPIEDVSRRYLAGERAGAGAGTTRSREGKLPDVEDDLPPISAKLQDE
jgi:hypothetical protein